MAFLIIKIFGKLSQKYPLISVPLNMLSLLKIKIDKDGILFCNSDELLYLVMSRVGSRIKYSNKFYTEELLNNF